MTDLIQASTVRIKSMADGSLDLTVRIEPKDMIAACTLFGAPGLPIVLGRLVMDHEKPTVTEEKPKGGPLSNEAGILCGIPKFREFLIYQFGCCNEMTDFVTAEYVREICGVTSRAEIDSNPEAKAKFLKLRAEYMNWSSK